MIFAVYSRKSEHFEHLPLCLEQCRKGQLSLSPANCAFGMTCGRLLGHIVSQEEIAVNRDKVRAILEAPTPTNAKALGQFLGQIRWHSRMIRYLADVAIPLHTSMHNIPFNGRVWSRMHMNGLRKCYLRFQWFNHLIGINHSMCSSMHRI